MKWRPMQRGVSIPKTDSQIAELAKHANVTVEHMRSIYADIMTEEIWLNDVYQCAVRRVPAGDHNNIHLSIKRIDKKPIHDWRALQRIKNEVIGPECEFVEIYPAESRLVDTANQYWLWGTDDPSFRLPFGFNEGRVVQDGSGAGVVQRSFEVK